MSVGGGTVKHLTLLVCVIAVTLASCSKPRNVVELDTWWDFDYAKNACTSAQGFMKKNANLINRVGCGQVTACESMRRVNDACAGDPSGGILDFEERLQAQFAADPACKDVQIVRFKGPTAPNSWLSSVPKKQWRLMLYFVPGSKVQSWTLSGFRRDALSSAGTTDAIAHKVCAIATQ